MNYTVTEVPRPYTDWAGLLKYAADKDKDREAWNLYALCIGVKENDEYFWGDMQAVREKLDIKKTPYLDMDDVRRIASVRLISRLDYEGTKAVTLSEKAGVSPSILSKFKKTITDAPEFGKMTLSDGSVRIEVPEKIRPLSLPLSVLGGVAAEAIHASVHNLMFGEDEKIVLSKNMRFIEKAVRAYSASQKNKLIKLGQKYKKMAEDDFAEFSRTTPLCEGSPDYGQYRAADTVLKERFLEMTYEAPEAAYHKYGFFSECNGPIWMRFAINHLLQETKPRNGRMPDSPYVPSLQYLMLWSLLTKTAGSITTKALDYFVCNDYIMIEGGASNNGTPRNRIPIYTVVEREEKEVTDTDTLRILSFCAALPEKYKYDFIAQVI